MKKVFLFMAFLLGMNMTAGAQTASDHYLDIANHQSVNDLGFTDANKRLDNLSLYTEYPDPDKGVAWLTMSFYGACISAGQHGWIEASSGEHSTVKGASFNRWMDSNGTSSYPFAGSDAYFNTIANTSRWGTSNTSNSTKQSITFYVTNISEIQIFGSQKNTNSTRPTIITIYECTKNSDGTLSRSAADPDQTKYTSGTGNILYKAVNLTTSKYYEIECALYRGNLCEIAFATPLNPAVITADPTSLSFATTINTPVTKTVNVKGVNLKDVINATVTNTTGNAFSINGSSSVSIADASSNDGGEISVTFNPDAEGNYAGTLILTTTSAQRVEIPLNGEATSRVFTVNISSVGLTTLYLNEPLQIPYDKYDPDLLGVYYIYAMNGTEMRAARLNNTIPANTAVIIQGNSGSYDFPVIGEADPLPSSRPNSYLSGCLENTAVADVIADTPGTVYTLGKGSDHYINFYKYTGSTLNANKAYYLLPSGNSAKALTLTFDDAESEVTGINTVGARAENGAWYSIQGVQLQGKPATKGIYIHNGKAVIVK